MMMLIHPIVNGFIRTLVLEIGVKDQPDSAEIRSILRQMPIANNRKEMRQLFRLPRHTLDEGFANFVDWFLANPNLAAVYDAGRAPLRVDVSSGAGI